MYFATILSPDLVYNFHVRDADPADGLRYAIYSGSFHDDPSYFASARLARGLNGDPTGKAVAFDSLASMTSNKIPPNWSDVNASSEFSIEFTGYFYTGTSFPNGYWLFQLQRSSLRLPGRDSKCSANSTASAIASASGSPGYLWIGPTAESGFCTSNAVVVSTRDGSESVEPEPIYLARNTSYRIRMQLSGDAVHSQHMAFSFRRQDNLLGWTSNGTSYLRSVAAIPESGSGSGPEPEAKKLCEAGFFGKHGVAPCFPCPPSYSSEAGSEFCALCVGFTASCQANSDFNISAYLELFHPTQTPTLTPSSEPSLLPTLDPTHMPTEIPSQLPSWDPSESPTAIPSDSPTMLPTAAPSHDPTCRPTCVPTYWPSTRPSRGPTVCPSLKPSALPSTSPSFAPTRGPSLSPSVQPTSPPSVSPSRTPSYSPSASPTGRPSYAPSISPTSPTRTPSYAPSVSRNPSRSPTASTTSPSTKPSTFAPSCKPTVTVAPSVPSRAPTRSPT